MTLRNIARDEMVGTTVTDAEGNYAFRNLSPATYEVQATKDGFSPVSLPDVEVTLGQQLRVDVSMKAGGVAESVEVIGGSSVLGTTATQEHGIAPETLNQLPLLFGTGPRAAATFALLMPGVSTGAGNNAFDARVNGGLQSGDEASVDGVSMQQGFMSQGGMVSILQDFPMSPDMVSQIKVLTSGYAPEYGSSTGGQIMAVTKSGGSRFHGAAFEFQPGYFAQRPPSGAKREGRRSTRTTTAPTSAARSRCPASRPTGGRASSTSTTSGTGRWAGPRRRRSRFRRLQERQGDFRDWRDPVRQPDPDLRPGHAAPRRQGRLHQGSVHGLRRQHAQRDLSRPHQPDRAAVAGGAAHADERRRAQQLPGAADPGHAFWATATTTWAAWTCRRGNNHVFASFWHQRAPAKFYSQLPQPIATETYSDPQNSWVNRMNFDKILTSTLVNHMSAGYLNRNEGYGCVNRELRGRFPADRGRGGQ